MIIKTLILTITIISCYANDPIMNCNGVKFGTFPKLNTASHDTSYCSPRTAADAGTYFAYNAPAGEYSNTVAGRGFLSNPLTEQSFTPAIGTSAVSMSASQEECSDFGCSCHLDASMGTMKLYPGSVLQIVANCGGNVSATSTISIRAIYPVYKYNLRYNNLNYVWLYKTNWQCTEDCGENHTPNPPICVGYTDKFFFDSVVYDDFANGLSTCCYSYHEGYVAASATAVPDGTNTVSVFDAKFDHYNIAYCVQDLSGVHCYATDKGGPINFVISDSNIPQSFPIAIGINANSIVGPIIGDINIGQDPAAWGYFGDYRRAKFSPYYSYVMNYYPSYQLSSPIKFGPLHTNDCFYPPDYYHNPNFNNVSYISGPVPGNSVFWNAVYSGKNTHYYTFEKNDMSLLIGNVTYSLIYQGYNEYTPTMEMTPQFVDDSLSGVASYNGKVLPQTDVQKLWDEQVTQLTIPRCSGCVGCSLTTNCTVVIIQNFAYTNVFETYFVSTSSGAQFSSLVYIKPGTDTYKIFGMLTANVSSISFDVKITGFTVASTICNTVNITYTSDLDTANVTINNADNTYSTDGYAGLENTSSGLTWWQITLIVICSVAAAGLISLLVYFIYTKRVEHNKRKVAELERWQANAQRRDALNDISVAEIAKAAKGAKSV